MRPRRYLVIGAAGHGQEVGWSLKEQARAAGESCDLLFFDDRVTRGPLPSGLGDVAGDVDAAQNYLADDAQLVLGIGLPRTKAMIVARLSGLGARWTTVIHPKAIVGPNVRVGEGSYIAAGAILTVNVSIGRFTTINMHCQVAHDGVLEEFVTLHPDAHLAGCVRIGAGAEVGTGAIVIQGVSVGGETVLGAGCVAIKNLPGSGTYVGVPARAVSDSMSTRDGTEPVPIKRHVR